MDISDTIKGKTVLSFEVINTICSRIPSVCISESVAGKARPLGPAWCLVPRKEEATGAVGLGFTVLYMVHIPLGL